jgi:hypothetical protein
MAAMVDLRAQAVAAVLTKASQLDTWFSGVFGPAHPLSADMPLVKPRSVAGFGLAYLAFVLVAPLVLRALRLSVKLKPVMRVYNLFMVVLSAYMAAKSILLAHASNNSLWCVPLAKGKAGEEMALLVWVFTFSKVIEFLDTIFMILEGRMRQVSFLHVYHHVSIFPYWFAILWISPGSDAYFSLAGNSFIHVLMYGYYLLASFGYSPWWKYYITKAQIFQFCCFCAQSLYVGYMKKESECDFPHILARGLLWYMLTLIALFMHFLLTNAGKKKSQSNAANAVKKMKMAADRNGAKKAV